MKQDFNLEMENLIKNFEGKPRLLLHSCCAPCSSSVLFRLSQNFDVSVLYYNPNIFPIAEFEKRLDEQQKFLEKIGVKLFVPKYEHDQFLKVVKGFENLGEKSERCKKCYELRLKECATFAKQSGFDFFCTTLTVSPHKNAEWVNEIGLNLQKKLGINFLPSDFKKKDGYLRSLTLSKEYGFYRQNYCGCEFSKSEE